MPTISRFFGIEIRMHFSDHNPPHFHALYGDEEALVEIASLAVCRGWLPRRALVLVMEWAMLHRGELQENWESARANGSLREIAPLE